MIFDGLYMHMSLTFLLNVMALLYIAMQSTVTLILFISIPKVQLQNLMTSKYIAHFLTEVSSWQKKLSTADSVISIWMEVQRTWSHLESIFIGSEDIRSQLPEDSQRFDGLDVDFKVGYYLK